jgi:acyl carrier protein phosphodiesterase
MNFLAHMLLSCDSDALLAGNYLGDLMRNHEIRRLPEPVQEGVRLHRKIDFFTDNHPQVRESTKLLHSSHGKYAPVLVDVYYDFFLSGHWERFHPEPLLDFTRQVYRRLLAQQDIMPAHIQRQLRAMVRDNWLMNYATYEGIAWTFQRMKRRVSRPDQLNGAVESLQQHEVSLGNDFLIFFPEIMSYVASLQSGRIS